MVCYAFVRFDEDQRSMLRRDGTVGQEFPPYRKEVRLLQYRHRKWSYPSSRRMGSELLYFFFFPMVECWASTAALRWLKTLISSSRRLRLSSIFFFSSACCFFSWSNLACSWGHNTILYQTRVNVLFFFIYIYIYIERERERERERGRYRYILRVSDQNGVSQARYTVEIHHSGREPSVYLPPSLFLSLLLPTILMTQKVESVFLRHTGRQLFDGCLMSHPYASVS